CCSRTYTLNVKLTTQYHTASLNSLSFNYIFFFFSSRRRHTRSKRDWSSDVCSSDLPCIEKTAASRSTARVRAGLPPPAPADQITASWPEISSVKPAMSRVSMSVTVGDTPGAVSASTCSGLRITEVTV